MRTVTRLKAANRRASRTAIELDGEPWAEIDTEVVLTHHLSKGVELEEPQLEAILEADAFVRARQAAARLLNTRPRSVVELRRRLADRDFAPETVEKTIAYFKEKGQLDDLSFARIFARHQFKTKAVGPLKVRNLLRAQGVEESIIEQALDEEPRTSDDQQRSLAKRFIERRLPRIRETDSRKRRRKIESALLRAGFTPDVFRPLLEEALDRETEPEK